MDEVNSIDCKQHQISVCMATYNGGRFIATQLQSILSQLSLNDEVVVCDDGSDDDTIAIINSFSDDRIKLHKNAHRLGIVQNFSKCISLAKGDIVFLSDQDDIWKKDKVAKTLDVFFKNKDVTLVATSAEIIDEKGRVKAENDAGLWEGIRPKWQRLIQNFIYNRYRGCTLAFRNNIIASQLPIPVNVPAHDWWIGLVNDLDGCTFHLNEPLVSYRRHSKNASSFRRGSSSSIIVKYYRTIINVRYRLLAALMRRRALSAAN